MEDNEIIMSLMEGGNSWAGKRKDDGSFEMEDDLDKDGNIQKNQNGSTKQKAVAKEQAQKMDMSRAQRGLLRKEFLVTFKKLNDIVKKETGRPIWNNFNVVKSGVAFNGSSNAMFDDSIPDDEFTKFKPKVGDIDITVPRDRMVDLFKVLLKYEDKKIGNIEYVGNNKSSPSEKAQINSVFKYEVPGSDYTAWPQVDFEPSEYFDDAPSPWDSFSHSSDWADIQKGFKGVTHKYALTIMAHIVSKDFEQLPKVMLLSGADKKAYYTVSTTTEKKIKKVTAKQLGSQKFDSEEDFAKAMKSSGASTTAPKTVFARKNKMTVKASHYLAFSVGKGLRVKYRSLLTKDDKPIMVDGKMLMVTLKPEDIKAETNLEAMFKLFFGFEGSKTQLKQMNSFVGVIELLKKSKLPDKKKDHEQFLDELIDQKLWGTAGQALERDSWELDAKIKWSMVNYIIDELKVGNRKAIEKIAKEYYGENGENYRADNADAIRESLIPWGSSFSTIFEAVDNNSKRI